MLDNIKRGGSVAQWVECHTCVKQVVGANPTWDESNVKFWASRSHLCASVTNHHSPSSITWYQPRGGDVLQLAESSGSLPPGG